MRSEIKEKEGQRTVGLNLCHHLSEALEMGEVTAS
jgi:hypothetical protein